MACVITFVGAYKVHKKGKIGLDRHQR